MKTITTTKITEIKYCWEKEQYWDLYVKDMELRKWYILVWSPMDWWHNTWHTPEQLYKLWYLSIIVL